VSWKDFLYGATSVLDLSGSFGMERAREILRRSDAEALKSDWEVVGQDMWKAIEQLENELNGKKAFPTKD